MKLFNSTGQIYGIFCGRSWFDMSLMTKKIVGDSSPEADTCLVEMSDVFSKQTIEGQQT